MNTYEFELNEKGYLDVRKFGAIGDGLHDDTASVQRAIDEAAVSGLPIHLLPGNYSVGELILHPGSVITAEPQWGFAMKTMGKTILSQRFEEQECVLDVSKANGATINGLSIMGLGKEKGKGCSGILSRKKDPGKIEDAYRIERTRVAGFSSHAVALSHVWCFTVRQSMFCFSGGDGLHMKGYDGFISDNWFSGNTGCGFGTEDMNCSVTMTGNRIEWNKNGGIVIQGGSHYNITGNYIDRSGKEAIVMAPGKGENYCNSIACVGNMIYRSGKSALSDRSSHVRMVKCVGVTFTGNSMCIGRDDNGQGDLSPERAMYVKGCRDCVISNNTMFASARKELMTDIDNENCVISGNVGTVFPESLMDRNDELPSTLAARARFE